MGHQRCCRAARQDDSPVDKPLRVAQPADRLGYREVRVGEGSTWDAFVLATAIGLRAERAALTAGPVPASVRDPLDALCPDGPGNAH